MSVVTATILGQGQSLDSKYQVLAIDVTKEVNRIPRATVRLRDGSVAEGEFELSDSGFFEPGKEIELQMRYEGERDETIFKGLVVRHGIEAGEDGSFLSVELKDAAVQLTQVRKSVVFRDQSDDEVIKKLIQDAGLEAGDVAATKPKHPELVQYHATDWDFMLARADVQGLLVAADDGKISAAKMEVSGGAKVKIRYGMDDVYALEMEIDASAQHSEVESVAWDIGDRKRTDAKKAAEPSLAQGNLDGGKMAKDLGFPTLALTHIAPLDSDELGRWADARMARSRMAMIRGRVSVKGRADIGLLDIIELDRMGQRFNGKTLVTGIRQRFDRGSWRTDLQFGIEPTWFCHREDVIEAPASGLLPAPTGLQIGVVDAFEDDPDEEYRVKVILPSIDESEGAVWARLATPDAGDERGYYFRPEEGDEVVVGFFNSDPRQPVILGAMFSSKNKPPDYVGEPSDKNLEKAIVTKKGTTIGFLDDDKASVFIETKEGNKILFDDDDELIEIKDQHDNVITMNKDGVSITSVKDLVISVDGKLEIKAASDIEISSDSKVEIDAPKTDIM